MTVVKVERIKDTYICTNQRGRKCHYDVATGEAVGYNGKHLKNVSADLTPFSYIVKDSPQKEMLDRLLSLGLISWQNVYTIYPSSAFQNREIEKKCSALMKNKPTWKKTLENLRGLKEREYQYFNDLVNFLYNQMLIDKFNLKSMAFEHIDLMEFIKNPWYLEKMQICMETDWARKAFIQWVTKIDHSFEEIDRVEYLLIGNHIVTNNDYNRYIYERIYENGLYPLESMIDMKKQYPALTFDETKSIKDNLEQWKDDIAILKNKAKSDNFGIVQTMKDYSFTSGDYTITVPTSYGDCLKISRAFNNCVGHFYWDRYLSEGLRLVVIVNKNNKPAICVGIDRKTMQIEDYLKPYNNEVTEEDDKQFRTEYQNYLKSLL